MPGTVACEQEESMPGPAATTAPQRRVAAIEAGIREGFAALDGVALPDCVRHRVLTLQSVPTRVRGALRTALRAGLQLIVSPHSPEDALRGWKLFMLAPRMLLYRSAGTTHIPPAELDRRCELFQQGGWTQLLQEAQQSSAPLAAHAPPPNEDAARAARATALVHLGELSAAGRALTSEPLAPGTPDTLAELRDPERRPPVPYAALDAHVIQFRPAEACSLTQASFIAALRGARRGAAAGPSGMTNEHLRILLDDEEDGQALHKAAQLLAQADIPAQVLDALRVGRVVALRKPNGRVRALVIGDVLRRLVGRVLAQAFAQQIQDACMPFQYGLSTRTGTEAVARVLRAATEVNPRTTVLSVDAVGAYDHVSRGAMLGAVLERPALQPLLPYVRQFYATVSTYVWTDSHGRVHDIAQGEGGEQGDPLMPALYSLAQHGALQEVQAQLLDGEAVFAYLDDIYVVAAPERIMELYDAVDRALWERARVQLNRGKTRIWNSAGEEPPCIEGLQREISDPVWVGDWALPRHQQGLTVLGTPLGADAFVQHQLRLKREAQDCLLQRIPAVDDLQAAWLLLRYCAAPRANYLLRVLPPGETADYARQHDDAISGCLATLLGFADAPLPDDALRAAQLAMRFGGLGLRSAQEDRHAAYWASWRDTLPVIQARAPGVAARLLQALQSPAATAAATTIASAQQAAAYLRAQGYDVPDWGQTREPPAGSADEHPDFMRGWQRHAAQACDERALTTHFRNLSQASRALLLSQAGPHAARAFTVLPTHEEVIMPSAQFRVLLLRRLRLPLPLTPHACRCGGALDPLGDHRAACATAGVLPSRAIPLERALARVCREAGARVAQNVRLADMSLQIPIHDARRIEVVCNGLPLWHGQQLAVDATIVSPVRRDGQPRPGADARPATALSHAAQRKRRQTYPELDRARRCRLVVFGVEVGGRWSEEAATFVRLLAKARARSAPAALQKAVRAALVHRWSGILSMAVQRSFAASLLELPLDNECRDGPMPPWAELLADARWEEPPAASRMPPSPS